MQLYQRDIKQENEEHTTANVAFLLEHHSSRFNSSQVGIHEKVQKLVHSTGGFTLKERPDNPSELKTSGDSVKKREIL